jgi:1-phosphofructokinase family hexose kinase
VFLFRPIGTTRYNNGLILTLTINPAIDRTISVDRLVFDDRAYILSQAEDAGGRGLNASRVIHSFGGKTVAVASAGSGDGAHFEELGLRSGFPVRFIRIANPLRINFTISDKQGLTIKLNELGPPITRDELAEIRKVVEAELGKAKWLMLCGSIPPKVDCRFYAELVELAHRRGVKTLVDSDGGALANALEAKPTAISPNQLEAERLLETAIITRSQSMEAAERIHKMGPESVVLSLGSRGALGISTDGMFEVIPPRIDVLSPIGSGDALAAAFVWAQVEQKAFADSLRWGVAAGTASAALPGLQFASLKEARTMYRRVEVRQVG